jgi:HPt (histidine-containing phosphotransfer) domain-containing protein
MTNPEIIDLATVNQLKEMMGAEFIGELIDAYCQETPQLIAALQQALAQGDADALQRAAHSIKSSSASLGALGFSASARELEMIGRGGNIDGVAPAVERLVSDYERVQSRLQELRGED